MSAGSPPMGSPYQSKQERQEAVQAQLEAERMPTQIQEDLIALGVATAEDFEITEEKLDV